MASSSSRMAKASLQRMRGNNPSEKHQQTASTQKRRTFSSMESHLNQIKLQKIPKMVGYVVQSGALSSHDGERKHRPYYVDRPIVLMNDPFSALDPMIRSEVQNEVHDL